MINKDNRKALHNNLINLLLKNNIKNCDLEEKVTNFIESLEDNNCINDYQSIREWFKEQQENCAAKVNLIDLNEVKNGWSFEESTGNLVHESGGFFSVIGVEIKTNIR